MRPASGCCSTFAAERLKTAAIAAIHRALDAAMVLEFLAHIEQERGNGPSTRNCGLRRSRRSCATSSSSCPTALAQVAPDRRDPGQTPRPEAHPSPDDGRRCAPSSTRPTFDHASGSVTGRCCTSASPAACASPNWSASCSMNVSPRSAARASMVRQGPERAQPAALEGDRARPARLAGSAGQVRATGAVRQRRGRRR